MNLVWGQSCGVRFCGRIFKDGKLPQNVISLALREHFGMTESNRGSLFADTEILEPTLHYV